MKRTHQALQKTFHTVSVLKACLKKLRGVYLESNYSEAKSRGTPLSPGVKDLDTIVRRGIRNVNSYRNKN